MLGAQREARILSPEIQHWSCQIIEVPTHSRLDTSYGTAEAVRPHVMVTLRTKDGLVGYGEASPLPMFTGETAESIKLLLEQVLLPAIVGRNPLDFDEIMDHLEGLLPENNSAKAAVDIALHDLNGKVLGLPVYRLLGGLRRPDGFPVTRSLGIMSAAKAVEMALHWTTRGFRTLKMKVGTDPVGDIERVRAVAESVPAGVQIRIDANQGYDVPDAVRVLRALGDRIQYCEQPVPAWNLKGLRHIREVTGVRILVDESVHTARQALDVITAQAADLIAIKLIKCGGLRGGRRIADVAALAGIHCVVVSPFETHVGAAAGVHLALNLPPSPFAQELSIFHVEPEGPHTTSTIATRGDQVLPPEQAGLAVSYTEPRA